MPTAHSLRCAWAHPAKLATRRLSFGGEPSAREAGALQAAAQVRVLAHHAPYEPGAPILDHGNDRALVYAEIVACNPAKTRNAATVHERNVEVEARIERIEEPIVGIDVLPVAS